MSKDKPQTDVTEESTEGKKVILVSAQQLWDEKLAEEEAKANKRAEADALLAEEEANADGNAKHQKITEDAVNRATEAFVDSHKPTIKEEPQPTEEQLAYDAQEQPKVNIIKHEHNGVKVSYPSDLTRSQAFLYLTHITNKIMSGAD